jgi:alginate O-acetyltransferase complex protein AlgI
MLKKTRWWTLWLLLASYFFYGWWNPLFLILIVYSTFVDYLVGLKLTDSKWRKSWLVFSLVNNLFLLGFFKYAGFFADNLQTIFTILQVPLTIPTPNILLPVGISFFTFQSMSYSIDIYNGNLRVEKNFIRFAAFVALFPQLVAGPIERARNLLPQMRHEPIIRKIDISDGISLFLVGLFKKVVMADILAMYVDKVYGDPSFFGSLALLFATYAFAWQIYFDFSGYTDMARGIAQMMGIRLMLNFNNPYTAVDLGDFWRRWHISLSSWFKDYVYIPLGGNRGFKYSIYWNIFLTMVISGFWHGAAWTFIIWGTLNAFGRVATMDLDRKQFYQCLPKIIKQFLVFHFICLTWVFFRAESIGSAFLILKRMLQGIGGNPEIPVLAFLMVAVVWGYQIMFNSRFKHILENKILRLCGMIIIILLVLIFSVSAHKQFIYFQF